MADLFEHCFAGQPSGLCVALFHSFFREGMWLKLTSLTLILVIEINDVYSALVCSIRARLISASNRSIYLAAAYTSTFPFLKAQPFISQVQVQEKKHYIFRAELSSVIANWYVPTWKEQSRKLKMKIVETTENHVTGFNHGIQYIMIFFCKKNFQLGTIILIAFLMCTCG